MGVWLLALLSWRVSADYAIVIESEVASSVVHVIKYQFNDFQSIKSQSVSTNLSSLVTFTPLYATAKRALENEGIDHTQVPLWVALTGYRALAVSSPSFVAGLVEDLYEDIAEEGFVVTDGSVFVPSGEEESVMRWLGTNATYSGNSTSLVVVDVSPSTVSVAFNMIQGVPLGGLFQVSTASQLHNFFVASYEGFGMGLSNPTIYSRFRDGLNRASISADPCGGNWTGFNISYDFNLCQSLFDSVDVLKTAVFCRTAPCPVDGMYTPRFAAFADIVLSGYPFDLATFFLKTNSSIVVATVDEVLTAAKRVCNKPLPASDWSDSSSACFGAAWLAAFTTSLGVANDAALTFTALRPLAQGLLLQRSVFPGLHNSTGLNAEVNCTRMAVVVDAGSSASKAKIYRWSESEGQPRGSAHITALETSQVKVKPGLASSLLTVDEAIASVMSLLRQVDEFVPAHMRASTPVHVVATGGVRNLLITDPLKATAIFEGVRVALAQSAYLSHPSFVTWLSGEQEGAFAWLAAYSLLRSKDLSAEVVAVEVGGATMQIALENPLESVLASHFRMHGVYGKDVELYSHSWNFYGRDESLRLHRELLLSASTDEEVMDPCQWSGFQFQGDDKRAVVGRANMSECLAQVREAVLGAQTTSPVPECELPRCFSGVHLPALSPSASVQFLGIFRNVAEFFGYATDVYANKPVATAQWWRNAMTMCNGVSYSELLVVGPQINNSAIDKPLDTYCHTAALAYVIIVDLLKLDPATPQAVSELNEEVSWALGYMISYLQSPSALRLLTCPKTEEPAPGSSDLLFYIYVGAGSVGALLVFVLLTVYMKRRIDFRVGREPMLSVQDQLAVN